MAVDQNPCCRGPPPLLQTFVAGPLLQTLVAALCVEYCSLQGACRGGVCRGTPLSVTNLCCEMAAQACYKANVFDSLPYLYLWTWTVRPQIETIGGMGEAEVLNLPHQ